MSIENPHYTIRYKKECHCPVYYDGPLENGVLAIPLELGITSKLESNSPTFNHLVETLCIYFKQQLIYSTDHNVLKTYQQTFQFLYQMLQQKHHIKKRYISRFPEKTYCRGESENPRKRKRKLPSFFLNRKNVSWCLFLNQDIQYSVDICHKRFFGHSYENSQ